MSLVLREKRSSLFAVISFSEHNLHPHESLLRKCESRTSELTCPVLASLTAPYTALCPSSHALILTVVSGGSILTDDVASSNPTTDISSPMWIPRAFSSVYPPMAMWSFANTIASISGFVSMSLAISSRQNSEKSPWTIILSSTFIPFSERTLRYIPRRCSLSSLSSLPATKHICFLL